MTSPFGEITLNNKFAIGCIVQWYEIEMVEEYLQSVKNAIEPIENKKNVILNNSTEYWKDVSKHIVIICIFFLYIHAYVNE